MLLEGRGWLTTNVLAPAAQGILGIKPTSAPCACGGGSGRTGPSRHAQAAGALRVFYGGT